MALVLGLWASTACSTDDQSNRESTGGHTGGDIGAGGTTNSVGGSTHSSAGRTGEGGVPSSTSPNPQGTVFWQSGFENGFPGEWLDYQNSEYPFTEDGTPTGHPSNWTIIGSGEIPIPEGEHVYKAWVNGPASDSHRPYPVIHTDVPSPMVNSFLVYIDLDYDELGEDWFHLATWGNNEDWAVHTLGIVNRVLEMAHLDWQWIGSQPRPEFPLRQWVRITAYIDYTSPTETIRIWQDGVPIMTGLYTNATGNNLMRAHWGLYAPATVSTGAHYNDDIQIRVLDEPLTDLESEP